MKIIIVGAPGAGKTKLAKELAKEYNCTLIDNIAQNFARRTKLAVGFPSDYRVDMILAGERLEKILTNWNNDFVMTSTILDSLAYSRVRQVLLDETEVDEIEIQKNLDMVGLFYQATQNSFRYDKVYFLPYENKKENLSNLISGALEEVLQHFGVEFERVQSTKSGTDKVQEGDG